MENIKKTVLFGATALLLAGCTGGTNIEDTLQEDTTDTTEEVESETEIEEEPVVVEVSELEEEPVEQVVEPEPVEEVVEQEPVVVEETFDEIIEREYGRLAMITHDEANKVYQLMPVMNDVLNIAQRVNRGDEEALAEWEEVKAGLANMHQIQVDMLGADYTLSLMHPTMVDTELLMMFDNQINDIPRNAVYSVDEYRN